jgi:ABC-type polysaccharide/polyol phosphate transport system ATPase subunit
MDESNVVIKLSGVSVKYRVPVEPIRTLKEQVVRRFQGKRMEYREHWALRNIDLDLCRGDFLGIIGRNGAGKSTLLKVICRVLKPNTGTVKVIGNVSSIIELGAGFHPELTGRENVFINGTMLGYSNAQIHKKFEEIVAFAELEDFIDSPLRTYSTGMVARLGFAVAADVEPDILVIDEVLAVGDERFQQKCIHRMRAFHDKGVTVLVVSHNVDMMRNICSRAVLIEHGQITQEGNVSSVIDTYRAL